MCTAAYTTYLPTLRQMRPCFYDKRTASPVTICWARRDAHQLIASPNARFVSVILLHRATRAAVKVIHRPSNSLGADEAALSPVRSHALGLQADFRAPLAERSGYRAALGRSTSLFCEGHRVGQCQCQ